MENKLTQKYLKECLHYDHETGVFTWKDRPLWHFKGCSNQRQEAVCKAWNTKYSGKMITSKKEENGYMRTTILYRNHTLHRLAFLYIEGFFPEYDVDHINGIKDDNRWCNLRHASRMCNMQNCGLRSDNSSGVTGVIWNKTRKKWFASIKILQKEISLGYFSDYDKAVMARYQEEVRNPNWKCSVESSAYLYLKENNLLGVCNNICLKNYDLRSNSRSGVVGVTSVYGGKRWIAYISINSEKIKLGRYKNKIEAVWARYNEEINNPGWEFLESSSAYKYLKENNLIK